MGDLNIIMGKFFTIVGYEVVTAPDNFFYSHAFTMYNSEPFTHTGILGSYSSGDWTFWAGWTLGWDSGFSNLNGGSSWLGGVSMPVTEDIALTYVSTGGNFGWRGEDGYSHSIVADVVLTERLNYVFQSDLVKADSSVVAGGVPGFVNDNSVGINQYFFYTINDLSSRSAPVRSGGRAMALSHHAWTYGVNIPSLPEHRLPSRDSPPVGARRWRHRSSRPTRRAWAWTASWSTVSRRLSTLQSAQSDRGRPHARGRFFFAFEDGQMDHVNQHDTARSWTRPWQALLAGRHLRQQLAADRDLRRTQIGGVGRRPSRPCSMLREDRRAG